MRVLITGANGYLAKNLADRLQKIDKIDVFLLERTSFDFDLIQAFPDVVIHTAVAYAREGEALEKIYGSNLIYGARLLKLLSRFSKQIIFMNCGTALPKNYNTYSMSKIHFVEFARTFAAENIKFINMRLQHFYGPNAPNNFMSYLIKECKQGNRIALTEGHQKRDFIFIDDVISAFVTVLRNTDKVLKYGDIDVGTSSSSSIREVSKLVKSKLKSNSILDYGAIGSSDIDVLEADIQPLKDLGWQPKFSFTEGLEATLRNFQWDE